MPIATPRLFSGSVTRDSGDSLSSCGLSATPSGTPSGPSAGTPNGPSAGRLVGTLAGPSAGCSAGTLAGPSAGFVSAGVGKAVLDVLDRVDDDARVTGTGAGAVGLLSTGSLAGRFTVGTGVAVESVVWDKEVVK